MVVDGTTTDLLPIIIIFILCPSGSILGRLLFMIIIHIYIDDNYIKINVNLTAASQCVLYAF